MDTISISCAGCGAMFDKPCAEVRRQRKKDPDRRFYCSLKCYAQHRGRANLGEHLGCGNVAILDPGNRQDQHSPFRYFMRKARNRKHRTNLDLPYLQELWLSQAGRCALSGVEMKLPLNSLAWERRTGDPWKPSLDRIDPTLGYLKGNVRYVVMIANIARQRFTDQELVAFCCAVAALHQDKPWMCDEVGGVYLVA